MSNIKLKTEAEIEILKQGGKKLAKVLKLVAQEVRPGVSTLELDSLARKLIKAEGGRPSFDGFGEPPFKGAICASVNEVLVHGQPADDVILQDGDIFSLDCGLWYKDLCTDHAITVPVGKISKAAKKLIKVTSKSLDIAIKNVKPGKTIGDMGAAVQAYVEKEGFSVIRSLVGHGVGYEVHEEPKIPNFGQPGEGEEFTEGMVLALEPMVAIGDYEIEVAANGWDIATKDKSLSAHFEHTIAITKKGVEILTK